MTEKEVIFSLLNWHKKIIKPWKKRWWPPSPSQPETEEMKKLYINGWNACLKEIEKNHKEFMNYLIQKTDEQMAQK